MIRSVLKRKFAFLKNSWGNSQFAVFLFLLAILLAGCASHIPRQQPLSRERQIQAEELLRNIQQRHRINTLDADVTVTWSGYGRKLRFSGGLQAVSSGRFRLSALDPLGRPIFLLVIQNASFTFIDNRQGRGYTGLVDSDFLHRYIPAGVTPATLFSLLTAQLPDIGSGNSIVGRGDREGCYWFSFPYIKNLKHMAEVDAVSGQVLRQMIVDASEKSIVDIHYDGYPASNASSGKAKSIILPKHLRIEGSSLPGSIAISLDTLYAEKDFPDSLFTIAIPKYFSIIKVN